MILTSSRRFGVEIEFIAPDSVALRKIANSIPVVNDGSLRPLQNAAEYVSPVLSGKSGELRLAEACETLKKHGATSDNIKTSVHVHLDGRKGPPQMVKLKSAEGAILAISRRVSKVLPDGEIRRLIDYGIHRLRDEDRFKVSQIDGVTYLSALHITRKPRMNYSYYTVVTDDRFKWLRNVFYFYTQYADVMSAIVSNSRRNKNMYCIPLNQSYDLNVIEACSDMDELRNVWYKGRDDTSGHYDDSRYHAVNLHSYWHRPGTVEIRSHGGTIEANKILMWTRLHQKIVDKLEDIDLNDIKFSGNHEEMCATFLQFIEEPVLQEYVRRLLGFYSNITIK